MGNLTPSNNVLRVIAQIAVGVVALLGSGVLIGTAILAPIDRAAKSRHAPVRFSICDFLCLFLAIQIPLSALHRFIGQHNSLIPHGRDNDAWLEYFWLLFI